MVQYRRYRRGIRPRRQARVAARKRVSMRSRMPMRRRRPVRNRVVYIRKECVFPAVVGSAGGNADLFYGVPAYSQCFSNYLNQYDLDGLSAEYEQIKVTKFVVTLERLQNQTSSAVPNSYVRKVVDNDNVSAYTSEAQYLTNADCKSVSVIGSRPIQFVVYPKTMLSQAYNAITTQKAVNPGWINTNSLGGINAFSFIQPHIFIPPFTPGVGMFNVRMTLYCCFKNNK